MVKIVPHNLPEFHGNNLSDTTQILIKQLGGTSILYAQQYMPLQRLRLHSCYGLFLHV